MKHRNKTVQGLLTDVQLRQVRDALFTKTFKGRSTNPFDRQQAVDAMLHVGMVVEDLYERGVDRPAHRMEKSLHDAIAAGNMNECIHSFTTIGGCWMVHRYLHQYRSEIWRFDMTALPPLARIAQHAPATVDLAVLRFALEPAAKFTEAVHIKQVRKVIEDIYLERRQVHADA